MSSSASPPPRFHVPGFSPPAVHHGLKAFRGKWQKRAMYQLEVARHSEERDETSRRPTPCSRSHE